MNIVAVACDCCVREAVIFSSCVCQTAVVKELRGRQRQVLNRDEISHGTLDDLINGRLFSSAE